ncbi:MAG TPA: mechanosensitive ion channel domain-containing protein [Steroidobacteraceae bacterium]|nr:mechanosensitive ion channel domain-containing protein [Steroidobacteraceae bacterium]
MRTYIRAPLRATVSICRVALGVATLAVAATALAAAPAPAASAAAADADATAKPTHVSVLTGDQVVQILDETVDWYRTLGAQQQSATQPSDLLILYANQQTADKVIGLAFEVARANAELLSSEANTDDVATETASSPQSLSQQQKRLEEQRKAIQDEIAADRKLMAAGKTDLQEKLSELQGELDMVSARKNLLDTMALFVNESDAKRAKASALKAHIDAIAVSIPSANTAASGAAPAAPGGAASQSTPPTQLTSASNSTSDRIGIWELGSNVLRLSKKMRTIDAIDERTADLEQTFLKIRTPPLEQLKQYAAQSDALSAQADNANSTTLKGVRDQFDTLAWLFQQTSAILIPLSKEGVLLKQYRHNLSNWRDAIKHQYHDALAALGVRLGVLALMLAVVFAGADVWRRAVLRYAHEPRRRNQLLMVRKVTTWVLVAVIVGLTFVTELSSFATFAGLLTAGVAVAMQSVLVSIVGYFFLIGKYGIRVGDRVQIGTVSGEVIDLGLVRMHLMELNSQGALGATGRVVAFANSIVFQASGGLFKQISGVNFAWRETTLALPAGADYTALKEKLFNAVNDVVKKYHDEILRQTKEIQRTTSSNAAVVVSAQPQVQLRFTASSVEALVRYPVEIQHAAEIDEKVSEAMIAVIRG